MTELSSPTPPSPSSTGTGVVIVIPAFNEESALPGVIKETAQVLPDASIVVVDDGSRDRTGDVATAQGAVVLTLPFNLGVGAAVRTGLVYARRIGAIAAVQIDADGQHNPADAGRLVRHLERHDVVIGARFAGVGEYDMTGPRRWGAVVLSKLLSPSAGTELTDTTSGFRAFGPRAIHLYSETMPAEYLGDTVDAIVTGVRAGLRITQVGVSMRTRRGGSPSTGPWRAALYLLRALAVVFLATVRREPELELGPFLSRRYTDPEREP